MAGKRKALLEGPLRGVDLVQRVIDGIREGKSEIEIYQPRPLAKADLKAACFAGGAPLPPSLRHWLAFDASWLVRTYPQFAAPSAVVLPLKSWRRLIDDTIGADVWGACYAALAGTPVDGRGIELDCGSDSLRALFVGKPDEHGEYPVLWADVDDTPCLGIEWPGFDVWLAAEAGLVQPKDKALYKRDIAAHVELNLGGASTVAQQGPWVGTHKGKPVWAGEHMTLDDGAEPAPRGRAFAMVAPAELAPLAKMTLKKLTGALAEAIRGKDPARIAQVLNGAIAQHAKDPSWKNAALAAAVDVNDPALVDQLVALGANPDAPSDWGTVLGSAAFAGHTAVLERLIAHGAALEHGSDQTALVDAAEQFQLGCVRALLAAGANPNATNENGLAALHYAARSQHAVRGDQRPLTAALLDAGASIDLADKHGRTPLHWAVGERVDVAALLVERGANPNARNREGETPAHLAWIQGRSDLLAAMIARGADVELATKAGLRLDEVVQRDGHAPRELEVSVTCSAAPRDAELVAEWVMLSAATGADVRISRIVDRFIERARLGVESGSTFPPASAFAELTEILDIGKPRRKNYHCAGWRLRLGGIAPEALGRLLGDLVAPHRADMRARALRLIEVDKGADKGTGTRFTTADAVAWLNQRPPVTAYPKLGFAVEHVTGGKPGGEIELTSGEAALALAAHLGEHVQTALRAEGYDIKVRAAKHVVHVAIASFAASVPVLPDRASAFAALCNLLDAWHTRHRTIVKLTARL